MLLIYTRKRKNTQIIFFIIICVKCILKYIYICIKIDTTVLFPKDAALEVLGLFGSLLI